MKAKDRGADLLPPDTSPLDTATFHAFDAMAQTSSRRGFLSRLGALGLKALGVGVAYQVLPIGRDAAKAAQVSCSSWFMCGFCGWQCGCSGCSGDLGECPLCACKGNSWSACCHTTSGSSKYRYLDCYSHGDGQNGPCSQSKINNCRDCRSCCNDRYPGTGPYPGGCSGTLMCTRVRFDSSC